MVSVYLERKDDRQQLSKAQVISQHVGNAIEVFSADRIRALRDLTLTWPDYHPNPVDWFNSRAVVMRNVLPGFEDIIWADENQRVKWNINESARQMLLGQPLSVVGLTLSKGHKNYTDTSLQNDEFGSYFVYLGQAINPYETSYGFVVASFDVSAILAVMVGELGGEQFNFVLYDGDTVLTENGAFNADRPFHEQVFTFARREWTLRLQTNDVSWRTGQFISITGTIMSLILCIFLYRQLASAMKLSDSQWRYKAASESSLDAIILYQRDTHSEQVDFELVERNRVAALLLDHSELKQGKLSDHLQVLGAQPLLMSCVNVYETGNPYETELRVETQVVPAKWVKIQIVKAGNGIAITMRDISARVLSQAKLAESEEKFRRLVEGLNGHFIYAQDADSHIQFVSASVKDVLGYDAEFFAVHHNSVVHKKAANIDVIRQQLRQGMRPEAYRVEYKAKNGDIKIIEYSDSPIIDKHGRLQGIEGIGRDVTDDVALQRKVYYQANHDQLTGLYNRYAFDRILNELLKNCHQNQTCLATLCFIDMDQFKLVNDSCGHQAGDELLKQVATILSQQLHQNDVVARIGGDEFCLIFANRSVKQTIPALDQLLDAIRSFRFTWDGKVFHIGASIGAVEVFSQPILDSSAILKAADNACYMAKSLGKNRYHIYDLDDQMLNYQQAEHDKVAYLQRALDEDRFELFYQEIVPLGDVTAGYHYEILVRMLDENGEHVSPGLFIPLAERYGLMTQVDQWVVENTLSVLERFPKHVNNLIKCSINLSGNTLSNDYFLSKITERLKRTSIPNHKLCFEVTETSAVTNLSSATNFIETLKQSGCQFSLDDFGAGMSSFTYLKNMPVDYVKIDGSFVRDLCEDKIDYATVKAIHEIATSMGKQTVAEFVTSEKTVELLKELGIDYAQGFALHKPEPLAHLLNDLGSTKQSLPNNAMA